MELKNSFFYNKAELSKHFMLKEFLHTSHSNLLEANISAGLDKIKPLSDLSELMEVVRALLCCPLVITSGFRCADLNTAIDGSITSQHSKGEACDFVTTNGLDIFACFDKIAKSELAKRKMIGQLIYEFNNGKKWIHISLGEPYRAAEKCAQILTIIDGKTEVYNG
jgi:hypothetical protein